MVSTPNFLEAVYLFVPSGNRAIQSGRVPVTCLWVKVFIGQSYPQCKGEVVPRVKFFLPH